MNCMARRFLEQRQALVIVFAFFLDSFSHPFLARGSGRHRARQMFVALEYISARRRGRLSAEAP